jgi:hypothetical protein
MYGGYKMEIENKAQNNGFKALLEKAEQGTGKILKRFKTIVFVALAAIILIFLVGCKPKQVIVEKEKLVYVTKDSIVHRDSTIYIPVEVYKDYALDTLVLRTSLAESKSWLDTSSAYIVGEIRNIKALEVKYIEVDKWHTKDSLVYKDKEVPVPVEVIKTKTPKWAWITLIWTLICLVYVGFKIYLKFWKP